MSRQYGEAHEDFVRSPSHRRGEPPPVSRDHSPEYYSGGGGDPLVHSKGPAPDTGPYVSGAIPPEVANGAARSYYELDSPLSPRDTNALQLPQPPQYRPRSVPQAAFAVSRGRPRSRPRTPLSKARHTVDHTFSNSSSGIGVGLLGAVVGGLAAREVSDAALRNRTRKEIEKGTYHPRSPHDAEKARVISTVVGALVGGLGANALERRFESARERDHVQQAAWERRWGREHERDHGRGRPRARRHDDWDDDYYRDYDGRVRRG
ncbi:hypothetical protein GQ607_016215 [Colletotrichum asianum]|uniref:Uncharacterized protein n=1 Tax=Colletotrichum asianum TaxID=702518 RepID=A0A8H3ZEF6_9PEZI|nr:hypothetical protein GQ607_016215 [Colletotrichum asianum]